jgi:hypothetical protein
MHAKARWITSAAAALITLGFSGCSASNGSSTAATSSPAPATSGQSYTTRAFSIPFTITVPASFKAQPNSDTKTFLTWYAASSENKVRFLLPVALYRPGQSAPGTPPKDYVTYLRGLSSQGATLADEKKITVDGHSATLMTGTAEHGLDGSIGCPQTKGPPDAGEDCYGLQPDVALRIAVIDVSGRTLLAWARTNKGASDASAFFAEFEAMLQSIKFR